MEEKSKNQSALTLTKAILEEPKNLPALFEVPQFRNNCIVNYQKTMGVSSEKAAITYERERVLFMKALEQNKALAEADRFSIYSSMVELFASGLSLNEGMTYIIPYKGKDKTVAQFQIGAKGRLEQMKQIPDILFVDEPQVVWSSDIFEHERGENVKILRHIPKQKVENAQIDYVYMYIEYRSVGKKCYIMTRDEVLNIRNKYSQSYKSYMNMKKNGKWQDWMELPMWVDNEIEAFKKTIIKRVWKMQEKTPRQVALEKQLETRSDPDETIDYGIADEPETGAEVHDDGNIPSVETETVDPETGEVLTKDEEGFTI